MASITSQHNRALSQNISVRLRGLMDDKINNGFYKESKKIFNFSNFDYCSYYRNYLINFHNRMESKINMYEDSKHQNDVLIKRNLSFIFPLEKIKTLVIRHNESLIHGIGFNSERMGNNPNRNQYFGKKKGGETLINVEVLFKITVYSKNTEDDKSYISGLQFHLKDYTNIETKSLGNTNNEQRQIHINNGVVT